MSGIATVAGVEGGRAPAVSMGDAILRIDPRYFRPAEDLHTARRHALLKARGPELPVTLET